MSTRKPLVLNGGDLQQIQSADLLDPTALGTGTPGTTSFLRGDNSWQVINLSLYAPLASPTFTGTVTVPTPASSSNTTVAASTAWVQGALPQRQQNTAVSTTATLTSSQAGLVSVTTSGDYTVTLPAANSAANLTFVLVRTDTSTHTVTISRAGTDTIGNGVTSITLAAGIGNTLTLSSDGSSKWYVVARPRKTQAALTLASAISVDCSLADVFDLTLGATTPTLDFSNAVDGQQILLRLKQDATGSRTVTWGTSVAFGSDIASVTLTATASKTDVIGLVYSAAAGKYYLVSYVRGF